MEGSVEPERNHPETEHPAAFNPSLELLQPHDHDMTEPAIQGENGFRLSQENRFPDYDHYPQEEFAYWDAVSQHNAQMPQLEPFAQSSNAPTATISPLHSRIVDRPPPSAGFENGFSMPPPKSLHMTSLSHFHAPFYPSGFSQYPHMPNPAMAAIGAPRGLYPSQFDHEGYFDAFQPLPNMPYYDHTGFLPQVPPFPSSSFPPSRHDDFGPAASMPPMRPEIPVMQTRHASSEQAKSLRGGSRSSPSQQPFVPMEQMGLTDLPGPSGPSQRLITVDDTASKLVDTVEATSKLVPTSEITSESAEASKPLDPEPAVEDTTLFKPKPISKSRRRPAESSDESYHPDMEDAEPEDRRRWSGRQAPGSPASPVSKARYSAAAGLAKLKDGSGSAQRSKSPRPERSRDSAEKKTKQSRSKSSNYRGVTKHRRSGRYEAHLWVRDLHRQVYLGGYETEEHAAEAYDVAALKSKGLNVKTNFGLKRYADLIKCLDHISTEELIMAVRRQSQGFSRGSSTYRGVTHHPSGRWEARIGIPGSKHIYLGLHDSGEEAAKAYDSALVRLRGSAAATNFSLADYRSELADYHKSQHEMFQQEGADPRKVDDDFEDWIKTGKRKSSSGNANTLHEIRDMRTKKDTAPNAKKTKAKPGAAQGQNIKKLPRPEEIVEDPQLTAGSNKEATAVRGLPHPQHSKARSPANAERAQKPSNTNQQTPSESRAQGAEAFTKKGSKMVEPAGSGREEAGEVQRLQDSTTAGQEAQGESSEAIAPTQQ